MVGPGGAPLRCVSPVRRKYFLERRAAGWAWAWGDGSCLEILPGPHTLAPGESLSEELDVRVDAGLWTEGEYRVRMENVWVGESQTGELLPIRFRLSAPFDVALVD